MVLSRTIRTAGSELGDVNFPNVIEPGSTMAGQNVGETRHQSCPDNDLDSVRLGMIIEVEKPSDIVDRVAD